MVGNDAVSWTDFLGWLNLQKIGKPALQKHVDKINQRIMKADLEGAAARMHEMYQWLMAGGKLQGLDFSSKMMARWLSGTGEKYLMKESEVLKYIRDVEVRNKFFEDIKDFLPFTRNPENNDLKEEKFFVVPTVNTDMFYGMGRADLYFTGCIYWDGYEPQKASGYFVLNNKYDWHKGEDVTVFEIVIPDARALMVEEFHGAKPFDIAGATQKITLGCVDKLKTLGGFKLPAQSGW
jgi:hypothetical protein